jgi:hypothetical protein
MDVTTLIGLALSLLGLTTLNETDPDRVNKPIG